MSDARPENPARDGAARRSPRQWFGIGLRGAAMGIAELVPGVSGGTIAFITGIYHELVRSIAAVDARFLRLVFRGQIVAAAQHLNLGFLLMLVFGMGLSILAFANLIAWLLTEQEIGLFAFFLGLILGAVVVVARAVGPWTGDRWLLGALGLLLGALAGLAPGLPATNQLTVTFAAGAVAICAWVLPGISGSFMLLLLGQYQRVITAITEFDLAILGTFAAGCATGLLIFTRFLTWLLSAFYKETLAFLCGFMLGAVHKLWPWRQTLSYYLDADGNATPVAIRAISPARFEELFGLDPMVGIAVLAFSIGLVAVWLMDRLARRES